MIISSKDEFGRDYSLSLYDGLLGLSTVRHNNVKYEERSSLFHRGECTAFVVRVAAVCFSAAPAVGFLCPPRQEQTAFIRDEHQEDVLGAGSLSLFMTFVVLRLCSVC